MQDATNFLLKLSQDLPPDQATKPAAARSPPYSGYSHTGGTVGTHRRPQAERIATVVQLLNTHDHRSAHGYSGYSQGYSEYSQGVL